MGRPRLHKIGDTVNMLTITDWTCEKQPNGKTKTFAICKCHCGNVIKVISGNVGRGTKSCGCLRRALITSKNTKHGDSGSRLYGIWKAMRKRCRNPNDKEYPNYGGRGIAVCNAWGDYKVFRTWALTNGYADHLTIDRINNDGDYTPKNCRWATLSEQSKNKRTNVNVEFDGVILSIQEWSRRTGILSATITWRIKRGWPIAAALGMEE